MERLEMWGALWWLGFAVYVFAESCRLKLGTWHMPGPGYFPFGAALLMGVASLINLVQCLREASAASRSIAPSERLQWRNIVLVTATMVAYVLLLKHAGFVLCTFFLVAFFQWVVAPRRWLGNVLVALSVSLGFHLVFNILLNAQLPRGFLGL